MNDTVSKKQHTLSLQNREKLDITGVSDVPAFNSDEITARCDWGTLIIKGSNLHMETLELESGVLKVSGRIVALIYNENSPQKGSFKRVFS